MSRRRFSKEFKLAAVRRLEFQAGTPGGETVAEVGRRCYRIVAWLSLLGSVGIAFWKATQPTRGSTSHAETNLDKSGAGYEFLMWL